MKKIASKEVKMHNSKKAELLETCKRLFIISIFIVLIFGSQRVKAADLATMSKADYLEIETRIIEILAKESDSAVQLSIQPEITYTEKEMELMARIIHAEAGICNELEKYRVGNVVLNRVNDETGSFKNTIEKVIYQKGQFTSVDTKTWNETPTDREYKIAKNLLDGIRVMPDTIVWFSKGHRYGELYDRSEWHAFSGW